MDASATVATSAMVTLASTVSASVIPTKYGGQGSLPAPRLLVGTGLSFFGLSILADVVPKVGAGLAACVAVTALTYYGIPIMDNYFVHGKNIDPVGKQPKNFTPDPASTLNPN